MRSPWWRRVLAALPSVGLLGAVGGCQSHTVQTGFPPPAVRYHEQPVSWQLAAAAGQVLTLRYEAPACAMGPAQAVTTETADAVQIDLSVMVTTQRPCPPATTHPDLSVALKHPLGERVLLDGSTGAHR